MDRFNANAESLCGALSSDIPLMLKAARGLPPRPCIVSQIFNRPSPRPRRGGGGWIAQSGTASDFQSGDSAASLSYPGTSVESKFQKDILPR
eukprot:1292672-Rhodomonas_salina.4